MTYSIVARDPNTGEIGVAVQTALPGVGRLCPWAEAGIGAVATQALVRVAHGPSGLTLMRNGHSAPEALAAVIAGDAGDAIRQIGMVDTQGRAAAHTGERTIRYAGHVVGEGFAVQANMMEKDTVPAAMAAAFEASSGPLVLRMVTALEAAQAEGGDFRGQQSAALKIVSGTLPSAAWEGVLYDVRVDDHVDPCSELRRICSRHLAYNIVDEAGELAAKGDYENAMRRYHEAVNLDPTELQMRFWFGLTMADEFNRIDLAEPILREVFHANSMWVECLQRYVETRPLKTEGLLEKLVSFGA